MDKALPGLSSLTSEELDLLRFILDVTAERWNDEGETQLKNLTGDPSFESVDALLEATAHLTGLPSKVVSIRNKLFSPGTSV